MVGTTMGTAGAIFGLWMVYLIILGCLFQADQMGIADVEWWVFPVYVFVGGIVGNFGTAGILTMNVASTDSWADSSGQDTPWEKSN